MMQLLWNKTGLKIYEKVSPEFAYLHFQFTSNKSTDQEVLEIKQFPAVTNLLYGEILWDFLVNNTAGKLLKYRVFSGQYFPVFGLNSEIYGVNLRIQSECRKIRARKNSVIGHFSRSVIDQFFWILRSTIFSERDWFTGN